MILCMKELQRKRTKHSERQQRLRGENEKEKKKKRGKEGKYSVPHLSKPVKAFSSFSVAYKSGALISGNLEKRCASELTISK